MYEQPQILVEADGNTLADTSEFDDLAANCSIERWLKTSQEKGLAYTNGLKSLTADTIAQPLDVQIDIRKFRQILRPASCLNRMGM